RAPCRGLHAPAHTLWPSRSHGTEAMDTTRIAVIVGSNRRDSINRRLAGAIVRLFPDGFEASWPRIDDLPLYNQDLEGRRPAEVDRFTGEVGAVDGLLVVTPEHNRSLPAVLKN